MTKMHEFYGLKPPTENRKVTVYLDWSHQDVRAEGTLLQFISAADCVLAIIEVKDGTVIDVPISYIKFK